MEYLEYRIHTYINSLPVGRLLCHQFAFRKISASYITGALYQNAWVVDSIESYFALLRFGSICVYNVLDRGIRGDGSVVISQTLAIRQSVDWNVRFYTCVFNNLPVDIQARANAVTPTNFEAALRTTIRFRNRRGAHWDRRQSCLTLVELAQAAWITQSIYLSAVFREQGTTGIIDIFPDIVVNGAMVPAMQASILSAWDSISAIAYDVLPLLPNSASMNNVNIAALVRNRLLGFVEPEVIPGQLPNTFLIRDNYVRACRTMVVASKAVEHQKYQNILPAFTHHQKHARNELVHMNYVCTELAFQFVVNIEDGAGMVFRVTESGLIDEILAIVLASPFFNI